VSGSDQGGIRAHRTYLALALLMALMWLALLPARPLFNPDEGRYAEIPREMLAGEGWIIPHLDGVDYIEKPPLQYWATAAALEVFGDDEFGARFYPASCALATLLVVWLTAERLWSRTAAWRTGAALGGMLLFVILGQLLTLDMSLTLFMTVSLAGFLLAQTAPPGDPPRRERRWMLAAWLGTALGVLTKGVVAAAIPAAVLVSYSLLSRDVSPWRRLQPAWGVPLFLGVTLPWHWLAARRLPDFLQFYFVHEHLLRYLTPVADRVEPWWFFAVIFLAGSVPFTPSALRALATGWRRRAPRGQFDSALFLWVWVVFIGVFFSLSDSKLIPYILPAMPALALLIGAAPTDAFRRDMRASTFLTVAAAAALAATALAGPRFLAPSERHQYFAVLARPLIEIAVVLALAGLIVRLRRGDPTRTAVFTGVGWCMAGLLMMRAAGLLAPIYSGVGLARAAADIPPGAAIYSVGTYDQTVPFYLRRTVKLVAYRGEFDFGLRRDPAAEIADLGDFAAEWRAASDGYAIMERNMFDDLRTRGLPMREVARDVRRVLVARR
jgi:4-amino-4-deoxy-L-arabinose transferase-like glycosyltransferase